MKRARFCSLVFPLVALAVSHPQSTPAAQAGQATTNIGDYFSASYLAEQKPLLVERAHAAKDGMATIPLKRYPGNMMNLMMRTRSGTGEMHANWSDILIALDGEADVITGGTLVDRTDGNDGESRGLRSEGGVHHVLHKGDLIHITPSTPHWTVLPAGATFTFLAIKIANPVSATAAATSAAAGAMPR